ncbi:RNase A-like domain-containing protein [Nocardioides taihuensis]|uniref:RNase A-like domain-containing protein n=1 Tax=Nocardioides taihuensis TaxID=1835606 RepID=A0ABW0BKY1_9ACTN
MIDGGGYATAATAFAEANAVAAMQYDGVVGALGRYAGMAGHDAVAADFAAAYDGAAWEALAGYADLVIALATLGHLTEASLSRHHAAEQASIIPGAVVYEGGTLAPGSYASVLRATPPTSLGGDATSLAPAQEWLLDQLEGIFWPSADTDALRAAANTWRHAGDGLARLADYADTATRGLEGQLSPEIPLALDAVADVAAGTTDLATQFAALGDACDSFAANVEARREELLALLAELMEIAVEGALISIAAGVITGGTGAGAAGSATAAKIAARYPRFAAVIALFCSLTSSATAALRAVREALALRRARFVKYLTARIALRGERGAIDLSSSAWRRIRAWDSAGSHLMERHIGKTDAQLLERLSKRPDLDAASSFDSEHQAVRAINQVIGMNQPRVQKWMSGNGSTIELEGDCGFVAGRIAAQSGSISPGTFIRVVLRRDAGFAEGFRPHTAYLLR